MASTLCDHVSAVHPSYQELEKKIDQRLENASNLVHVASEADGVLSKLIAAKSPVLLSWLDKRELMAAKEEKIAQEWRKYYLNNFIFPQFPTKNEKVNSTIENLFSEIDSLAFTKPHRDKIISLFTQAKNDVKTVVSSWNLPRENKIKIIHRLDTLKLYWFEKLQGTRYSNKPLEFVGWGFAYDPTNNEINVGIHARKYPTDANIYSVLLHEMGHSLDPCRWSFYFQGSNPFNTVLSCLRSPESVVAKARDDSKMAESLQKKLLSNEMADSLKKNPTCNRSFYPPEGTQKDQILESFADWFATEVYATSSFKKELPRPDLCQDQKLMKGSSYLPNIERLLKIYLVHPELKNLGPKKQSAKYCPMPK